MIVSISSDAEADRSLSKRFPFCVYYTLNAGVLVVVAVIDACRDPLWVRRRLG